MLLQESGLMIVTPLSEENREKAQTITNKMGRLLGVNLWTPHQDITHGRLLERRSGITEAGFGELADQVASTLNRTAASQPRAAATLDLIEARPGAVIARATSGLEPVIKLRRWFLRTLEQVPECHARVKDLQSVHTTLGRVVLGDQMVPNQDLDRVAHEVAATSTLLPLEQTVGLLVIAEEKERYVLTTLHEVNVGTQV